MTRTVIKAGFIPLALGPLRVLLRPRLLKIAGIMAALIMLLLVFGMTAAEGKKRFSLKIPAVVLSWIFFVFAFTYGNALSVQKDYTDFRTQLVISDLQEMEAFQSDTPVTVQLSEKSTAKRALSL